MQLNNKYTSDIILETKEGLRLLAILRKQRPKQIEKKKIIEQKEELYRDQESKSIKRAKEKQFINTRIFFS